ncbi:MAG TPA: arginine deiminase family protein [Catalimonadaceae bacterium]|jgi:arginine deiminase|nr:arginine deiminase family protein [Catalimonadaceae bacterium]
MKLRLNSEFGTLKAVLMHRPGKEIDRLTPYNISEYLFEDMPYLEIMQQEHDEYRSLIKGATGATVYRLLDLLIESLIDDDLLIKAFQIALAPNKLEHLAEDIIGRFSTLECANALIAGVKVRELKRKIQHKSLNSLGEHSFAITASPNSYFMRDPAAVVQTGVISCQMKHPIRNRESFIMRMIFENHPLFKENFNLLYPKDTIEEALTEKHADIEGGDIIVLSSKALAIGNSERSDSEAIQEVAKEVLRDGTVERVYEVFLPKKRNFMHLDTVFTIIDENLVVTYPDAMQAVMETRVHRKEGVDANGQTILSTEVLKESILEVLKKEIDYLEIIHTGDGNPDYASREQWFDGANVFAIGPRRVISYNRNRHTNRALREAGVEVLTIPSSELSRGLGGPRCMTMALDRQDF